MNFDVFKTISSIYYSKELDPKTENAISTISGSCKRCNKSFPISKLNTLRVDGKSGLFCGECKKIIINE